MTIPPERFWITFDNDSRVWTLWEGSPNTKRVIATGIPSAIWAEAMVEWANSLDLVPGLYPRPLTPSE